MEIVYFVSDENRPIKIGKAKNPMIRLAQLQTSSALKLSILGVMRGVDGIERKLHKQFSSARMSGEWFERHEELMNFISMHTYPIESLYATKVVTKTIKERAIPGIDKIKLNKVLTDYFSIQSVRMIQECRSIDALLHKLCEFIENPELVRISVADIKNFRMRARRMLEELLRTFSWQDAEWMINDEGLRVPERLIERNIREILNDIEDENPARVVRLLPKLKRSSNGPS